jgi:hypothetical protein
MHYHELEKKKQHCLLKMQEAHSSYNHWYNEYMHYHHVGQQPYFQFNPYVQMNPQFTVSPFTQVNPNLEVNPITQVNPNVEVNPKTNAYLNFDPDFNLNIGNKWG